MKTETFIMAALVGAILSTTAFGAGTEATLSESVPATMSIAENQSGASETAGADTERYVIDPLLRSGVCGGWGVSLCCWGNECGIFPDEEIEEIIDWLVSPDGLNFNVFRYAIAGGDDPLWRNCDPHHFAWGHGLRWEIESFKTGPDEPYDWGRDSTQRKIMLMIRDKRPDAVFEAFSNSPPWWMTVSGCVAGSEDGKADNLRPDMYGEFAQYLVDVCRLYKEKYGIEFTTLEPFNEPLSDWWTQNGGQEGCHFDAETQIAVIKELYPRLLESGLKTVISASDETRLDLALKAFRAYDKAGVLPLVGQWNTHTYFGWPSEKARMRQLCDSAGIRLWQSETGCGGYGIEANIKLAQRLVDDMRYMRPSVWCDWQYVEQNTDLWGILSADDNWKNCNRRPNYYIRQQFSRFIPAGYEWIDFEDKSGLAAVSPDGRTLVYATVNYTSEDRSIVLDLPEGATLEAVYRTSVTESCRKIYDRSEDVGACMDGGNGRIGDDGCLRLPPLSVLTAVYSL